MRQGRICAQRLCVCLTPLAPAHPPRLPRSYGQSKLVSLLEHCGAAAAA